MTELPVHVLRLSRDEAQLVCTALAKLREEYRSAAKTEHASGPTLPEFTPDVVAAWEANARTADRLYEALLGSVLEASA